MPTLKQGLELGVYMQRSEVLLRLTHRLIGKLGNFLNPLAECPCSGGKCSGAGKCFWQTLTSKSNAMSWEEQRQRGTTSRTFMPASVHGKTKIQFYKLIMLLLCLEGFASEMVSWATKVISSAFKLNCESYTVFSSSSKDFLFFYKLMAVCWCI